MRTDSRPSGGRTIRASELGLYAYCQRAWWLERVQGYPSGNLRELDAGARQHHAHGRGIKAASTVWRLGWILAAAGFLILVMALLLRVL